MAARVAKPAPFRRQESSSGMSFFWAFRSTNLTMSRHFWSAWNDDIVVYEEERLGIRKLDESIEELSEFSLPKTPSVRDSVRDSNRRRW